MSAYLMTDRMLYQPSNYNPAAYQQLLRAAMSNYSEPQHMIPEQLECEMELLNADLWKQFHGLGTEMIITKNGRRMFPSLSVQVKNLKPGEQYAVAVEMIPLGSARWRRAGGVWAAGGSGGNSGNILEAQGIVGVALHPDGPAPASRWNLPINFNRLKLTNNIHDSSGNIVLTSMCKYQPRIRVMRIGGAWPAEKCFTFSETEFIAVTAYQNEQITQLKIDNNPFAKGFRKCGQGRCKRKTRPQSPDHNEQRPSKIRAESQSPLRNSSESNIESTRPPSPVDRLVHHSDRSNTSSPALDMSTKTDECGPMSNSSYEETIDVIGCESTSSRSPTRSPSLSSESSYPTSHHEELPPRHVYPNDLLSYNDLRFSSWSHNNLLHTKYAWMPNNLNIAPGFPYFMSMLPSAALWPQPLTNNLTVQSASSIQVCRPKQPPKRNAFTIRAILGEN